MGGEESDTVKREERKRERQRQRLGDGVHIIRVCATSGKSNTATTEVKAWYCRG